MFQLLLGLISIFLFAVSLSLFSKSAEQRARSRTELYYAQQVRENAEAIRLENEKTKLEINNMERMREIADITKENVEPISSKSNENQVAVNHPIMEKLDSQPEVVLLKELELDEKALEFVSQFQPKQEEIKLPEGTIYEEPKAWFNFPEVDLYMNQRPEKGLYYVAGKVIDALDEMSAIISDGTGDRMMYHHKAKYLSVGDVIIAQVEIHKSVWNFVNVWEINVSLQEEDIKNAM